MRKGFTLLEMMVVIMVIAVLLLLTIPNIQKVIASVEEKGCEGQVKVVQTAVVSYLLEYDRYPSSSGELISSGFLSDKQAVCKDGHRIEVVDGQAVKQ